MSLLPMHLPAGMPDWVIPAAGVTAVTLLAFAAWAAGRHTRTTTTATAESADTARQTAAQETLRRWRAAATALTILAAAVATATALNGMWHVFGDALGLDVWARLVLVGFLEIPLVTSAIRARVAILEGRTPGGDGAAMWVLAVISAVLSAADAATTLARALRLVVPLVAAWMWHQSLAADRRTTARANAADQEPIAWRWSPRRLAVRLGLADPVERSGTDVAKARRLARLTKVRLRLAVLSTPMPRLLAWLTLRSARRAVAAWRLQRQALAAVEHLRLGCDPTVIAAITSTVAAVVGLADATDPEALAATSPWTNRDRSPIGSAPRVGRRPERPGSITSASQDGSSSDWATGDDPVQPDPIPAGPILADPIMVPATGKQIGTLAAGSDRADPSSATSAPRNDLSTSDRSPTSNARRVTVRPAAPPPTAEPRAEDVARLRRAVADGHLPARPTVEAVRRHLRISPAYARAARAALGGAPARQQPAEQYGPHRNENAEQQHQESQEVQQESDLTNKATAITEYQRRKGQEARTGTDTHATALP
jgi:hypothetical protein